MCELFNGAGTTSCTQVNAFQGNIAQAVPAVFSTSSVQLGWHLYTGGWSLSSQFDQFFRLYNGQFASSPCGGGNAAFAQNYIYYCRVDYDHVSRMLEFNDTVSGAVASAQLAMQILGKTLAVIPIWSSAIEIPYQKGWTGVNDATGVGPANFFSLLNAWNPSPAISGILRWGFQQGTVNLNPFRASTPQELYIVRSVYDSLVQIAPYNPNTPFAWLANSFGFANADAATNPQCASVPGTTQCIVFNLRPDVHFHDGVALTGSDVKFSMLAFKQIPGSLSSSVAGVIDVTYVAGPIPGTQSVFVHLNSESPFAIFNVGGVPIIPQHIWASDTTTACPGTPTGTTPPLSCTANTTTAAEDPVTNHVLIGTGPFECVDLSTGQVGGGCTRTASGGVGTQAVDTGGTILLQRFGYGFPGYDSTHSYFHRSRFYKVWEWADAFNHGSVDAWALSAMNQCWNVPVSSNPGCLHWVSPASSISCVSTAGTCNAQSMTNTGFGGNNEVQESITEVSEVLSLSEVSWTSPLAYSSLLGVQPAPQTVYEGGITYSGGPPSAGQPVPGPANLYINPSATRVQAAGSTFTVQVRLTNLAKTSFNSWDVQVRTNPSSVRATTVSTSPNVFSLNNIGGFQLEQIHCV